MIIESREPDSNLKLIQKDSPDSKREFFEVGDYLLNNGFAVERKKGRDLMGSLQSKRLYEQLNNLCQYEHPILAIVTDNLWRDFYFSHSRFIHDTYMGTISTIIAKYPKMRIVQFETDADFCRFLISLEKKINADGGPKERPKPMNRKATKPCEIKENCLCAIPGVGVPMSKKLLKKFGSVRGVSQASEEDLLSIEKLGKKTAKSILETLN